MASAPKKLDPAVQAALDEIAAELKAGSKSGAAQFLKSGDTTIKLALPQGADLRHFYQPFQATFQGGLFPYYLVAGVITEAAVDNVADPDRIRYIKVTKTILQEIVNLISKRWDLFAVEGPCIVINKGKKADKVSYSVAPIMDTHSPAGLPYP